MSGEIHVIGPSGRTAYVQLLDPTGQRWNGSGLEAFLTGDYAGYVVPVTEDGSTGIYRGDVPSGVPAGHYDVVLFIQSGGSPVNGDRATGAQALDWRGSGSAPGITPLGSLTGLQMRDYIVRSGLRRDDSDTEVYDGITDTILEMEQMFDYQERQLETITTDTITVVGQYKMNLEADYGNLISLVLIDNNFARKLTKISKTLFDLIFPNPTAQHNRGYPQWYTIFANQILVGPAPYVTTYQYRLQYSRRLTTAVDMTTNPVPFSAQYREVLKDGTLSRVFENLKNYGAADRYRALYIQGRERATKHEKDNRGGALVQLYNDC